MQLFTLLATLALQVNAAELQDGSGGVAGTPQTITPNTSTGGSGGGRLNSSNITQSMQNARANGSVSRAAAQYCNALTHTITVAFNAQGTAAAMYFYQNGAHILSKTCYVATSPARLTSCTSATYGNSYPITSSGINVTYQAGNTMCNLMNGELYWTD